MSARRGYSLIEVMIALTMMSIVLVSVANIGTALAVRGRRNDMLAKRNAALQLESNKLGSVPFANLAGFSTADKSFTLSADTSAAGSPGAFSYTRRLTITPVSSQRYTITVTVVPTVDPTRTASVTFDRTLPSAGTPLCVGC